MPPRKKQHVKIQQALCDILTPLLRGRGFLTNELPFRPAPEHQAWEADVGFVSQARWDADDNDYFLGAPDLVIEVLSKNNTMDEILERQDICLSNGCVEFWTVDPKRRTVMVTTPDRRTIAWDTSMKIPAPFSPADGAPIPVAAIFGL
jgi:Uma2 family endonuclease